MFWEALPSQAISARVLEALNHNVSYLRDGVLGFPGSYLDPKVFPDAPFLENAPFLQAMMENPNHIGCHTTKTSESVFAGTQGIEVELLTLCAEQILGAEPRSWDGYVSSGGTESNIHALWAYRNALCSPQGASSNQICVIHSEDAHYSIIKAANLLCLDRAEIPVTGPQRQMDLDALKQKISERREQGTTAFIVVLTMGTTMFGTVDEPAPILSVLDAHKQPYRVHVDAAFGGFIYPFINANNPLNFNEARIGSFTLDGHKMLGAPYGTGIFLARRGILDHVVTQDASYVEGLDRTLIGSRSGANAIAMWMILRAYGSEGGREYLRGRIDITDHLCAGLESRNIHYVREPAMNIVAIAAGDIPADLAAHHYLVPDTHQDSPSWWKIVVMDHVDIAAVERFLHDLPDAT